MTVGVLLGLHVGGGIQNEVGIAQAAGLGNPGATSQRLDTGEQFGEVEWFGQVIIGTQPEPFADGLNRSGGGGTGFCSRSARPPGFGKRRRRRVPGRSRSK